ncbi:MAG: A/G-specific adenine glycosylase, partial [Anaerolineales bacterium]
MPEFSTRILNWYQRHARVLPWRHPPGKRGHPDSYAVWVSEIMLQQTRVETVIPYFERWMRQFPTLRALAEASEQAVLSAWEGLGYYSRARNLHKAAQQVVSQHNGELPRDIAELRKLSGIGRYTAAAIASIAFGQDVATLDGNLKRVFSRVFDVDQPADSLAGEKTLWSLAEANLPSGRAGDYNQSLMDLGATVCLPKNPLCLLCPLAELCQARALGVQEQRPVLKPKPVVPRLWFCAARRVLASAPDALPAPPGRAPGTVRPADKASKADFWAGRRWRPSPSGTGCNPRRGPTAGWLRPT